MEIQKYFFAFVYDMISVSDFEKWVYENADIIETKVNADILSELLECDYNSYIDLILIFNQPIDKFDSYNAATRRQAPLPGDSPPAVAFLDWQRSTCRLCLQND